MKRNSLSLFLKAALLLVTGSAMANVSLPTFFSDNMVLQRNADVKLWGWGSPNEEITITTGWDNKEYKVKPNNQANWAITIKTPGAGGPYTLTFKGYNEITFKNVMLGEVWLCSGQSNMDWNAEAGIDNKDAEIAKANYPDIRFFTVPKITARSEQINLPGNWQECTPQTMKYFSAVGYFFAETLHKDLKNVPIGIINSSWGGTPAEIWMPQTAFSNPTIKQAAEKLTLAEWGPTEPSRAYNAMINPLAGFKIAGALWYQGESNVGSGVYDVTLGGLINSWRNEWKDDFPFYFVQIAPYNYAGGDYQGVTVRNSQRKVVQQVTKTGMVVISDVSPANDIHPRNKRPVGERLGNMALKNVYGLNKGEVNSPLYKSIAINKNKITIYFDNAEGLHFKSKTSSLFEVAGTDGTFHPATAKIEKNTVVLTSKEVKQPVKVRYAWHNTAQADLFNGAQLPASSFISE